MRRSECRGRADWSASKPRPSSVGHRRCAAPRPLGQRRGTGAHRVGPEIGAVELGQPGRPVRREDRIGRAGSRQQLIALEDDLVLEGVERDAHARAALRARPRRARSPAARSRGWRTPPGRQAHGPAAAVLPRPTRGARSAPRPARPAHSRNSWSSSTSDSRMNSTRRSRRGSASRMARSKTKSAMDLAAGLERVEQGGVVVRPQVPAKPHQPGRVCRFHNVEGQLKIWIPAPAQARKCRRARYAGAKACFQRRLTIA